MQLYLYSYDLSEIIVIFIGHIVSDNRVQYCDNASDVQNTPKKYFENTK